LAVGAPIKKTKVLILTDSFVITGIISVPANMRFSDAINKFLREQQFLAVTDAEISLIYSGVKMERRGFILINKDMLLGISPSE